MERVLRRNREEAVAWIMEEGTSADAYFDRILAPSETPAACGVRSAEPARNNGHADSRTGIEDEDRLLLEMCPERATDLIDALLSDEDWNWGCQAVRS